MILRQLLLFLATCSLVFGCTKVGRETVECDILTSFDGNAKSVVLKNCYNLSSIDDFLFNSGPWPTVANVTFDCNITSFPWNFADVFPNIRYVNLPQCSLTTLPWQSVYTDTLKVLDLTSCPIDCTCANQWMKTDGTFEKLKVPLLMRKCVMDCEPSSIRISQSIITGNAGENVSIHVDIQDRTINRTMEKPYFEWAYAKNRHNYEEVISQTSADLIVTNLSRDDIGLIGVKCWHCIDFLNTKVELRVKLPIKVEFVAKTRGDTDFLVVQGYPIDNITLAITRLRSNYSETNILDNEKDSVFFSSLLVRPEKRSIFYQRTYRIFTKDAAEGDHLSGDLRFEVCTLGSCDAVEKHVSHLGVITIFNGKVRQPGNNFLALLIVSVVLLFFLCIFAACLIFRKKVVSFLREKATSFRKGISWAQELQSRRASQETEETLLRLEERSSLSSSDYSNQIIPFIDIGNIKIHERLGRGAFGEVYCGSWEKTGERSVAVKTIKQADCETEKEALTIIRLDHPNIVKLYGVTRDNENLLLVFELMNLGDLKSYIRAREPVQSTYLQYPAALTNEELKKISYEIIDAVCYLVEQQIVHRDLAARNCLVSGASDLKISNPEDRPPIRIKISDFGMSRRLYNSCEYYTMGHQGVIPVRWLPPEAVQDQKFTYMSDIWALGVTMWECFSFGGMPFGDLNNLEVSSYTVAGMRPLKPKHCPQEMYDLMSRCWHVDPAKRVTAHQLRVDPVFEEIRQNALNPPTEKPKELTSSKIVTKPNETVMPTIPTPVEEAETSATESFEEDCSGSQLIKNNPEDIPILASA